MHVSGAARTFCLPRRLHPLLSSPLLVLAQQQSTASGFMSTVEGAARESDGAAEGASGADSIAASPALCTAAKQPRGVTLWLRSFHPTNLQQ